MHRLVPGEPCPELDCAESEQIVLNDRCCKVCRGTGDPLPTDLTACVTLPLLILSDLALTETSAYAEEV